MFCSSCGKENSPESTFCSSCGARLALPAAAVPPAYAPASEPAPSRSRRANLIVAVSVLALLLAVGAGYAWRRLARGGAEREAGIKITMDGKTFEVSGREEPAASRGLADEYSADTVRGQVVDTGWRKYVVRSSDTGKTYVFHVGRGTSYNTRGKPGVGSRVRITYHLRRGTLIGDRVVLE